MAKEVVNKIDAYELSVEISATSSIINGLANQCDNKCDHLTEESLRLALFGVCRLLDRIANDVEKLE
ncbi:MAG: hypothetical protein IJZ53_11075 [Tyzzerella sp.]|nr:hypothetical protein [Tyzzerella sp.]